jgi:nucleotide-binding universal stress UspA family protein
MFQHILLAIDGSDHSRETVPAAIEIAKRFDGDVFVLHVHEHEVGRAGAYPMEAPEDSSRLVSDVVKTLQDAGVTAQGKVQESVAGHAPKHIVETAESQASDLIIMGSRGLSDLAGLLLGSVTHKVIQLAREPVLVVRAAKA